MPPKILTHAPRNPTRRSREERQALDRVESERRQVRANASAASAAAEAASRRPHHGHGATADERLRASSSRGHGLGGSLKYVRGGRGGFIGERPQTEKKPRTSAPSNPATAPAPVNAHQPSARGGRGAGTPRRRGRAAAPDGQPAPVIKADPEGASSNALDPHDGKQKDEFGNGSSDDEAELGQNVEYMNLVSEDEQEDTEADGDVTMRSSVPPGGPRRPVDMFQPLRMKRKPHKDRNLPFGVEILTGTGSSRKDAKSKARRESTLLEDREGEAGSTRQRASASQQDFIPVKQEPGPSRTTRASAHLALLEDGDDEEDEENAEEAIQDSDAETKEAAANKARSQRRASRASNKRPIFITAQDRLEYEKQQRDLVDLRNELGRVYINGAHNRSAKSATDAGIIDDTVESDQQVDPKEGAVYLFQLPPVIPDLIGPSSTQQHPGSRQDSKNPLTHTSKTTGTNPSDPIKVEDNDAGLDGLPAPSNLNSRTANLPAGLVGQLHVRKSGRTTLTWGSTNMEVNLGTNPYFLQTVVLADMPQADHLPEEEKAHVDMDVDQPASNAEAVSFGQLRGKFVVTPDWNEILG